MASDDETTRDPTASEHDDAHEHADADEHTGDNGEDGDHGEHAEGHADADRAYDPHKIELPGRSPPLRSTAPQSDFATTQVVRGAVVLVIGLVLTFGLGIVLA